MVWNLSFDRKSRQMLAIIFGIVIFLSLGGDKQAYAESKDVEFVIHGMSMHFNPYHINVQKWNQRNAGGGIRLPLGKKDIFALQGGIYKNSYNVTSYYLGVDWLPIHRSIIEMGAGLGTATGYPGLNGGPIPIGGPVIQLKAPDWMTVRFRVFPPVVPHSAGAISLELSWRLNKLASIKNKR
jgi:hypothetical protein